MAKINKVGFRLYLMLSILMIYNSSNLTSQECHDSIYTLIGLMDFNQGPARIPNSPDEKYKINAFFERDTLAISVFKKLLEECNFSSDHFEFRKIKTIDGYSGPTIFSEKYSQIFNSFFEFKYRFTSYQKDEINGFKVYSLHLKKSKFKTLNQKILFLKGLFIRYGSIDKRGNYQYKFDSNRHNMRLVIKFLKNTGSKISKREVTKNLIPGTQIISFIPSERVKVVL